MWKKLQLDTASTTNTLALDDLQDLCPAAFDIPRLIKPSTAILCTYGGGMVKPVGQIELTCETQGKLHNLQFQLLSRDVMGSQPSLLSGSDCVKLGLVEVKGNTPSSQHDGLTESARKPGVFQLETSPKQRRKDERPSASNCRLPSLNENPTEKFQQTDSPQSTVSATTSCEEISEVYNNAASTVKDRPVMSKAHEMGASISPGKLTKDDVMEAFKDVHTGLETLGSPLLMTLNPNVTPIQAHPHRCPVAKEAKAAEAIRDLEKQGILKKVTEPTPWISNSVYREKPDESLRVCIDPSQTINEAIEIPKYPIPTVDELLPKLNNAKVFSCVDVYKGFTNIELDKVPHS